MIRHYFYLSLILHGLLLLIYSYQCNVRPVIFSTNIPIYFYQNDIDKTAMNKNNVRNAQKEKTLTHLSERVTAIYKKNKATKQNSLHSAHTDLRESHLTKNISEDNLANLLHRLIVTQQSYPDSALATGARGTSVIGFWLDENGSLSKIKLLQGSGHIDLDNAALIAVNAISPVAEAKNYLTAARYFSVQVKFE